MITKLTPEQEAQIPVFIDKWIKQASMPMNHKKAIEYTKKLYKKMGQEEPLIIFGFSPLNTALLCSLFFCLVKDKKLFNQLDSQLYSQFYSQFYSLLDSQLRSQLYSQLDSQLYSQLDSQLRSQLYSQFYSQLDSQLYSQLDSQLRSQLYSQLDSQFYSLLDSQLRSQLYSQFYSQLDSQLYSQLKDINQNWYLGLWWLVWCGWYEYGKFIGVDFTKKSYDLFINFNSEVHFIIPYKGVAFISEKPVEIKWRNSRLHNDTGMAVRYSDNYGLWCLSGVKVPDWLVTTPAEKIDPKLALKETNVDVQREIIRKVGAERMLKSCDAKTLDDWNDPNTGYNYKLMTMEIGDRIRRKYLYFEHASMKGVWYAKPVPPEVNNALQARAWILSIIERDDLKNIDVAKEAEIISALPETVT